MTPTIGISQLGQIAINVQDPERATAFYRDVLGLPEPAERNPAVEVSGLLGRQVVFVDVGNDRAGQDGIAADTGAAGATGSVPRQWSTTGAPSASSAVSAAR